MKRWWVLTALFFLLRGDLPAETGWSLWDAYAASFISPQGRVIDADRNAMTTSEGQSYAMFFSLVANDRATFDRVLGWTEKNLASGDLGRQLPAWSWGTKKDGSMGVLDPNSASDADLWMAYTLLEAGRLWKNPSYSQKGGALLSVISSQEVDHVPGIGPVLLPGKVGFHPAAEQWFLNPSYLPLPVLLGAAHYAPRGSWKQMAAALPVWLKQASPAGFAMDWVECDGKGVFPAAVPGDPAASAKGSYDAIRVYLWAGMAADEMPQKAPLLEDFAAMAQYVKAHGAPPESVAPDGHVLSTAAPPGFLAAISPFLFSTGDRVTAETLLRNVKAQVSSSTGLLGEPARYYDQNLALFALGWYEKRFRFAPDGTLRPVWKK
ncbi:cellulose synthase complex periplasmic endoglucanase BcsZ [Pseudacidobacterium ailaaui]|jgi:endoglucanase|uniref:cellulose synthase complex periplasmic endoglucanase BcsZ n=1 Tax=Pseudacidobacterium ailaaui TaxID=1382359 RepID=UPI00047A67B9|nr:cellulose synthase complex periplasmic endoglucanase BcsZ [Pseudacidobacterium ailaaui]